jgi:hypothetical protein
MKQATLNLESLWLARNRRYFTRKVAITPNDVELVVHWRMKEIDDLPVDAQAEAKALLSRTLP